MIGGAVNENSLSFKDFRTYRHRLVLGPFGHVQGEMAARRVARQEHPVLVEPQFSGVRGQVIQPGGAIGQFVPDVPFPVVQAVFQQDDIVSIPEEDRSEVTVVLPLPGHIETAVYVNENGILPDTLVGIIDIKHLRRISPLHIRDTDPLFA